MRGVVFVGDRRVELRDFRSPAGAGGGGGAGAGVRPLRQRSAALPRGRAATSIGGHEPCGEVAAIGPGVAGLALGDRVIVYHYAGCGACKHCRSGWEQLCARGGHRVYGFGADGGNAEAIVVPARALLPLPAPLTFEEGAAIACGTGTAYAALKRLDVSGRDTLAVYGQGPVGLSATLLGKAMGARVIAIDLAPARLDLARALGADETVRADEADPVAAVAALTGGEGADATIDCTGSAAARARRCAARAPSGAPASSARAARSR